MFAESLPNFLGTPLNRVMDIRPCTESDLDRLLTQWQVAGNVHEAHFAGQSGGATTYLVAWCVDEPLGSAVIQWSGCVGENARKVFPQAVEINHLQVREEYRGRGIGTGLIAAAEQLCVSRSKTLVTVGVADENPEAEKLYRRLGYRRSGVSDMSRYVWVAPDGTRQQAEEHDLLLLKNLG